MHALANQTILQQENTAQLYRYNTLDFFNITLVNTCQIPLSENVRIMQLISAVKGHA